MSRVVTAAHCRERLKKLVEAVDAWEKDNSADIFIHWGGNVIKAFTIELEKAFEIFIDETADEGLKVGPDAKPYIMVADRLAEAYVAFKRGISEESPSCSPNGTDSLWRAYASLLEVAKVPVNVPKPMPISQLVAEKVSHIQIANIFGWKTEDGSPDVYKVAEEIQNPGSQYDPKTWVSPALKSRQDIIDRDWAKRGAPRTRMFDAPSFVPNPDYRPPSIEVMVLAGATPEQIARTHGIPIDEAEAFLAEAVPHSDSAIDSALSAV